MAYLTKEELLENNNSLLGQFTEVEGDLIYTLPDGKAGTVTINASYRDSATRGILQNSEGEDLPIVSGTISVAAP